MRQTDDADVRSETGELRMKAPAPEGGRQLGSLAFVPAGEPPSDQQPDARQRGSEEQERGRLRSGADGLGASAAAGQGGRLDAERIREERIERRPAEAGRRASSRSDEAHRLAAVDVQ